jgi:hypothetical protein
VQVDESGGGSDHERTSDCDDVDQAVQRRKVTGVPRVEREFD